MHCWGGRAAQRMWPGGRPQATSRLRRGSVGWRSPSGHLDPEALLMARACLCPAWPSSQSTPMPPVHELAMRGRHSQWAVDGPAPPAPTEPARLGLWSVVGLEPGSHFLEDGLVVVIQRNALVYHLPADGQSLVTGVQMLRKQRGVLSPSRVALPSPLHPKPIGGRRMVETPRPGSQPCYRLASDRSLCTSTERC